MRECGESVIFALKGLLINLVRVKVRVKAKREVLNPLGFKTSQWQRVKDSNPHIQSQSLLCYPYTNPLDPFAVVHRSEQILLYTKEDFCQQVFQKNFIIF